MGKKLLEWVLRYDAIFKVLGLVAFAFLAAVLMSVSWDEFPSGLEVGKISRQDIRADKDYEIMDEAATQKSTDEAVDSVLPVFDWDEEKGKEKIVASREDLDPGREKGLIVRRVRDPDRTRILFKDLNSILTLEQARSRVRNPAKRDKIEPTIFFNEDETQLAREKALSEIKPVIIKIQAGESIIRSGDQFKPEHLKIIDGIRREKTRVFARTRLLGTFSFVGLFSTILFYVLYKHAKTFPASVWKDFLFVGTLTVILIILSRSLLFVADSIRQFLPVEVPLAAFFGLMPVAAGTMMVRLVLPLPIAILFALLSGTLSGLLLQGSLHYTLFYLAGSLFSIPLMQSVRSRGQILRAGLELGLCNLFALFALDMVNVTSLTGVSQFGDLGIRLALAFLGGPVNSVVALILMPIFESLFNYLTPIKLLEFGSLNHPILREMIMRAPGTYHHSHMVGTLAEAACEAIGADSLFARVASYFHDIGKMKKSPYFIENQPPGEDRHNQLAPSMSALIIGSHVKDGIEMARKHKLPQKIIDIIPQHQGTKLISYFYNKAKEAEDSEMHVVNEKEYRYAGPKPQTREAGVILLADTSEAATRSLKDRSPARLEEVVRNVINKNFIDGQLDECELTLRDLHLIAKNFVRILIGIYHQRIEYPPDPPDSNGPQETHPAYVDKYLQSKPLSDDPLRPASEVPPKNIRRLRPEKG